MATKKIQFSQPYEADTQIGKALANISSALFGGPGPAEQAAARAKAEAAQMAMEVDRRKLQGQNDLGATVDRATDFARYSPGTVRDPSDPNWDVKSAAAKNFYNNVGGYMAGDALRSGVDVGQAAQGRVLTYSTPLFSDSMKSDAAVGAGKVLSNYGAFSQTGQRDAEVRQEGADTRKAVAGAVASHPEAHLRVRETEKILAKQPPNSPDRRVVGNVANKPTADMDNARARADKLGLDATEEEQLNLLNKWLNSSYKSQFGNEINHKDAKAYEPEKYKRWEDLNKKWIGAKNRPNVPGYDPADGTMPSQLKPGVRIRVEKNRVDNKWYAQEVDGMMYPIEQ